ncbi:MAG: type II secretion system F family protein, partial [Eubacteriales bacterium]|nr:type II secretion system F family protein [Eubacteriales bacterium]
KREDSLGVTTERALECMVERVKSDDLEMMITAILIQRQTGGNLAEILDNISTTIRERVKLKKEVKTLTATGRMSGIVISLLPVGLFLVINLINPEYMILLYTRPLGYGIIAYAIVSELIGIFMVNKICKVEV